MNHDLDSLGLPDCPAPERGGEWKWNVAPEMPAGAGTLWLNWFEAPPFLVFDIPVGESMRLTFVQADDERCYSARASCAGAQGWWA